ncbi:MAG: hypothetical protein GY729_15040 [Desulfobacteraceae bacterium]|nr:hypothetical protein [Desulfobacteraceae bacterium]
MADKGFLAGLIQRFKKMDSKYKWIIGLLFASFILFRNYKTTTFRVLDAETKEPIQGAVAIAMWTSTKGLPGLSSTYTAKAIEAESDKNGILKLTVKGKYARYKPRLKIYKPGYVVWDSKLIYLGCREDDKKRARYKRREGFSMKDQDVFLEPWKDEYTFISHDSLIQPNIFRDEAIPKNSKYDKAIEYETPFYIEERNSLIEEYKSRLKKQEKK